MNYLSFSLLRCCLILTLDLPDGNIPTYELKEALDQNLILLSRVEYIGDQTLRINLENPNKKKDINIRIGTGLQFASQDTSEQDQLVLDERTLLVKAASSRSATFTSYCTQADHLSPGTGSRFDLKPYADGKLLQLAQFLSPIQDIDHTAQQAIWVITNDHDLKGLYHADQDKAIEIQNFVAHLSGKPRPAYTVRYRESAERQQAFQPVVISIHAVHEYELTEPGLFSCKIYSESGEEVKEVFKDMQQARGRHRFSFQLETTRLPKGKYVSRVFRGDQVFQEIWVES